MWLFITSHNHLTMTSAFGKPLPPSPRPCVLSTQPTVPSLLPAPPVTYGWQAMATAVKRRRRLKGKWGMKHMFFFIFTHKYVLCTYIHIYIYICVCVCVRTCLYVYAYMAWGFRTTSTWDCESLWMVRIVPMKGDFSVMKHERWDWRSMMLIIIGDIWWLNPPRDMIDIIIIWMVINHPQLRWRMK